MQINWWQSPLCLFCEPFVLWGVGLAFRLFEETLLKISRRYHKQGNSFCALIFILAPDTPQIMRFLYISLHHKLSCNLVYKENVQRHIWKLLGICDTLKQQYSHSGGFVPLWGDGRKMRVGGSSIYWSFHMKTSSPCGEMQALGISAGSSPHCWDPKVWAEED